MYACVRVEVVLGHVSTKLINMRVQQLLCTVQRRGRLLCKAAKVCATTPSSVLQQSAGRSVVPGRRPRKIHDLEQAEVRWYT